MVNKIISGGQTGADRAGLDFAIEVGLPHGGYCPKHRISEDGRVPDKYRLTETSSRSYPPRTKLNVQTSDATVIFVMTARLGRGSVLTYEYCESLEKPKTVIFYDEDPVSHFKRFLTFANPRILNVAGSRESKQPGIHDWVLSVLLETAKTPGFFQIGGALPSEEKSLA